MEACCQDNHRWQLPSPSISIPRGVWFVYWIAEDGTQHCKDVFLFSFLGELILSFQVEIWWKKRVDRIFVNISFINTQLGPSTAPTGVKLTPILDSWILTCFFKATFWYCNLSWGKCIKMPGIFESLMEDMASWLKFRHLYFKYMKKNWGKGTALQQSVSMTDQELNPGLYLMKIKVPPSTTVQLQLSVFCFVDQKAHSTQVFHKSLSSWYSFYMAILPPQDLKWPGLLNLVSCC